MLDRAIQILFLGEKPAWLRLSQALGEAPEVTINVHRLQSPADAIRTLAAGRWDALAVDMHAWSFQGLMSIKKTRVEYPDIPIIALLYPSVQDLEKKAKRAGASQCLSLKDLTADALYGAVLSDPTAKGSEISNRKARSREQAFDIQRVSSFSGAKNEIISHALNNLLCVINANADILADRLPGTDPGMHSVAEIKKAARRAAELMRHLK